jgi:hypothetical protein
MSAESRFAVAARSAAGRLDVAALPAAGRLLQAPQPGGPRPAHPAAIWAAFARQAAFKSWLLIAQLFVIALLVIALIALSSRPPDIVLVDSASGKSSYLPASVKSTALERFLAEHRQEPSDATIAHFAGTFLKTFLGMSSLLVDSQWAEATSMMAPGLRERMEQEAKAQKLVPTLRALSVGVEIHMEALELVQRAGSAIHLKARVLKRIIPLSGTQLSGPQHPRRDEAGRVERLGAELVLKVVPRSMSRPDGLEVTEYAHKMLEEPGSGEVSNVR